MGADVGATAPVFLIGFMASGKTTVGRLVAARAGRRFVDLDDLIAQTAGKSVARLFHEEGEAAFRMHESRALRAVAKMSDTVIATGGGAACNDSNLALMLSTGTVVALAVSAGEATRRAGPDSGRPLLAQAVAAGRVGADHHHDRDQARAGVVASPGPVDRVAELLAAREAFYARAHHRVDTGGKSAEEVAAEVLELIDAVRS